MDKGRRSSGAGGTERKSQSEKPSVLLRMTALTLICSSGDLSIRSAMEEDTRMLARWRSDPKVIQFYSGRDRPLDEEGVRRHYFGRETDPGASRVEEYQPCILEVAGRPVGFLQFYRILREDALRFGFAPEERTFGIDLFLGETDLWGQGLGARSIDLLCEFLKRERHADRVMADPRVDNPRSVRAFEKARFRKARRLEGHEVFEGVPRDCWLMVR
ncbi:MAG: GNAT family N-acetyltransferase [Thermoplasmata archaeon]|nr:GNAT family N-acetyltransferase [Thermoplasmata archaeon]